MGIIEKLDILKTHQGLYCYNKGMSEPLSLQQLTALVMHQAKEKGFGVVPEDINVPEKIALIHSEVSEAYEAYRHKNIHGKDGFEEELGDVLQRLLHLCGALDIDLEVAVLKKLDYNKARTWDWDSLNEAKNT